MPAVAACHHGQQLLALLLVLCLYSASCFDALSLKSSSSSFTGTCYQSSLQPWSRTAATTSCSSTSRRFPFTLNANNRLVGRLVGHNHHNDDCDNKVPNDDNVSFPALNRRQFFQKGSSVISAAAIATTTTTILIPTLPAHAGALLQFPVGPETQLLKNKYHFMRAGLSELEDQGIYSTNALFLTNRENAMNVDKGQTMVLQALDIIKRSGNSNNAQQQEQLYPTIAYHSLAANGMDTGDLIARELKLGREKLLPEFTYLDQRGVGLWDSGDVSIVQPAIWALDYEYAGKFGINEKSRPPPNNDGTPNETLGDAFVRLRQFISLQESRTSGETILVIFPDGTGPALLSCMIAGIPFRDVHALEFAPGEIRLNVTPESVRALYDVRKDDPEYLRIVLQEGKEKLALLRQQQKLSQDSSNDYSYVGLKEEMAEKERLEIDAAFEMKKRMDAKREQERLSLVQEARQEKEQRERERLRAIQEVRQEKERQRREAKERERNEQRVAAVDSSSIEANMAASSSSGSLQFGSSSMLAAAAVAVLGLGVVAMSSSSGGKDDTNDENNDKPMAVSTTTVNKETSIPSTANIKEEEEKSSSSLPLVTTITTATKPSLLYSNTITVTPRRSRDDDEEQTPSPVFLTNGATTSNTNNDARSSTTVSPSESFSLSDENMGMIVNESSSSSSSLVDVDSDDDAVIQEQLDQLAAAEQTMKDSLVASSIAASSTSSFNNNNNKNTDVDDDTYQDDAWLRVLVEIRDDDGDDEDNDAPANTIVGDFDFQDQADNNNRDDEFVNDAANNTAVVDFDLMLINGDGRKQAPSSKSSRSADL